MCTFTTSHHSSCNCVVSRTTTPCPEASELAGLGAYRGSICPAFEHVKVVLDEGEAKCYKHRDGEPAAPMMGGMPERKGSVGEAGAGLGSDVMRRSLERKGSQDETGAGLAFSARTEKKRSQGEVGLVLGRKGSRAVRVKAGKVREMVRKFDGAAVQEEPASEINTTTKGTHMGSKRKEIEGKMNEMKAKDGMATKINRTSGLRHSSTKVRGTPSQDEERKKTYEGILQAYSSWEIKRASGPRDGDAASVQSLTDSEFDEIFGFKDMTQSTNEFLDHNSVALHSISPLDQDTAEGEDSCIADIANLFIEFLAPNSAVAETILPFAQVNTTTALDQIPTQEEFPIHGPRVSPIAGEDSYLAGLADLTDLVIEVPSHNPTIPETNSTLTQASTTIELDEDKIPVQGDFQIKAPRFSTLVRQYSGLVAPTGELDEPSFLEANFNPMFRFSTVVRQYSDLVSPITDLDNSIHAANNYSASSPSTASSPSQSPDPVTPSHQHLAYLDSPSTTPLLLHIPTHIGHKAKLSNASSSYPDDEAAPYKYQGSHSRFSNYDNNSFEDTPPPGCHPNHKSKHSSASSTYSHNSENNNDPPLLKYHHHTNQTDSGFSSSLGSDPFYVSTSSATFPPTLTPQTSFGDDFNSQETATTSTPNTFTPQTSFGTDGSNDAYQEWEWEDEEVEDENGENDGRQSLIKDYIPIDGTVWNWDGSRWVGQREDGSFLF
jgi:hypothetical protein